MDDDGELDPELAGRLAIAAVAADVEYWARRTAVDGRVGLNDFIRTLDVIREASSPEPLRSRRLDTAAL
jgi:hypothetical protein